MARAVQALAIVIGPALAPALVTDPALAPALVIGRGPAPPIVIGLAVALVSVIGPVLAPVRVIGPGRTLALVIGSAPSRSGAVAGAGAGTSAPPLGMSSSRQGLTFVRYSAQLERFVWDRGCAQGLRSPC
jgi:hypothetical protein